MANYIDGFAFPIASDRINEYQAVASAVAGIYREHGAIEYLEFVGDELNRPGTQQFPAVLNVKDGETVVFGWIVFASKSARDEVNKKVEADPRMEKLVAPLLTPENPVFEPQRMAYGGFRPLVDGCAE